VPAAEMLPVLLLCDIFEEEVVKHFFANPDFLSEKSRSFGVGFFIFL